MNEINNLVYFLKTIKDTLPFEIKSFHKKIQENKDFRIKVQKLVYLSKYFGWDNQYHFNFHNNGPFSLALSKDYNNIDLITEESKKIPKLDIGEFKSFIENSDVDTLEAQSTLLYYSNKMKIKTLTKNNSIDILKSLKPHISKDTAEASYDNIVKYNLFNQPVLEKKINSKRIVNDKAEGLMEIFEQFKVSSNRLFILGSLDYINIVLKLNINKKDELKLLNKFYRYAEKIEKEYFKYCTKMNEFAYLDLTDLKMEFELLEEYVSDKLQIMPKFDETSDLTALF